jgi:formylglycine-generating enzyme required for sulfatase activity
MGYVHYAQADEMSYIFVLLLPKPLPQHEVVLPGYWIGKYPVTNAGYRAFVEGEGYQMRAYWTEAGWKWKGNRMQPVHWIDERYNYSQQPVVGVTWYEAVAYCRWLSERTGVVVRLPSEAEWEKAARGTDGRIYPWGDEFDKSKCNVSASGIGKPTPVGQYSPACYPELVEGGDSPYGCADMAGNVWEWCVTKWESSYEGYTGNDELEGRDPRALRGGSFLDGAWNARCASRCVSRLRRDWLSYGFRVVVASPISSHYSRASDC